MRLKDRKVKELQDNIAAVAFTAQSKMGTMLTLQEENEEIGNQAIEGQMHELTMKLALQKSQNAELKSDGLCKQMEALTNYVERSNEMVLVLKEKLEDWDAEIRRLKEELQQRSMMDEEKTELAPVEEAGDEVTIVEVAET